MSDRKLQLDSKAYSVSALCSNCGHKGAVSRKRVAALLVGWKEKP